MEMNPICPAYLKDETKPCYHYLKPGLCVHPSFFRCIEYIRAFEPVLSYSSMQSFVCHRKFYLSYILGLEPIEKAIPLRLGSICSKILDQLHSKELNLEKVRVRELIDEPNINDRNSEDDFDYRVEALISVLQAYVDHNKHMEKGQTQCEFRYKEPEMPQVHGFIDMLEYDNNIGFEFKYTSNPSSYSKFTVEDQLSMYFLAHRQVQRFTVRTILNPIGNTLRQGKNEQTSVFANRIYNDALARPSHYFHDQSYWRNEFDLDEYREKIKSIARDITRMIDQGKGQIYAFRKINTPHTCYLMSDRFGGPRPCEYLSACTTGVISETIYQRRGGKMDETERGGVDTGEV